MIKISFRRLIEFFFPPACQFRPPYISYAPEAYGELLLFTYSYIKRSRCECAPNTANLLIRLTICSANTLISSRKRIPVISRYFVAERIISRLWLFVRDNNRINSAMIKIIRTRQPVVAGSQQSSLSRKFNDFHQHHVFGIFRKTWVQITIDLAT